MLFLLIPVIILGIMMLASILTNYEHWKYYPIYYKELGKHGEWYGWDSHYQQLECDGLPTMTYFAGDGTVRLKDGVYLHNPHVCQFDPYYFYWSLKYRNWFKKNVLNYTHFEVL
jgi:hypothetical protein